jgi:hypothetical protein
MKKKFDLMVVALPVAPIAEAIRKYSVLAIVLAGGPLWKF